MMRCLLRLTLTIGAALCIAASACDDDGPETSTGGGGTTATGGAGAGANCYGDAEAWDVIPKTNIPCVNNSDCCVVFNGCLGEGQVVSADDFATAGQVWPYCDDACVQCLLPIIEVECHQDECIGYEQPFDADAGILEGEAHCGVDEPIGTVTSPGMLFSCVP